ncbi:MAG: hypothetical protein PHQ25_00035 [Acidobacteriota bacterium]|nr:hypothetical protein [Acidobacteriota bacterium]MDW3228468.1 hypothetical protein [Acidobacteriota bacterium]
MSIKITMVFIAILAKAMTRMIANCRHRKTLVFSKPIFQPLFRELILTLMLGLTLVIQLQSSTQKNHYFQYASSLVSAVHSAEKNHSTKYLSFSTSVWLQNQPALLPQDRIHQFLRSELGPARLEKLEQNLKTAVSPDSLDLYLLYFWLTGRPVEGLCLLQLNLPGKISDPYMLSNTAAFLMAVGQYRLAQETLLKAQALLPDNPSILNNLGVVSYLLDQLEESRKFFQSAILVDEYHPEANRALYLLNLITNPDRNNTALLKKSLQGAYRESLAKMISDPPLPLSSKYEAYLSLPIVPEDFPGYLRLIPYYQEAFLKMEEKEVALKQELESLLSLGLKFPTIEATVSNGLALNSTRAYFCLTEIEGQLDYLEREIERPADIQLEQLITQAINKLNAIVRDYQKKENDCLALPRPERPECLAKVRQDYCQAYLGQAEYYYQRYKKHLLSYFSQFEARAKESISQFYFWVRYLPEDQQLRKRTEIELRFWQIYSRLWEKTFRMVTKLSQPVFSDCFPELPLIAETKPESEISLYDPFSTIGLNYQDRNLTVSIRADRVILALNGVLTGIQSQRRFTPSTVYLYPPPTHGPQPLYLVLDEQGKLNDLAELGPWGFTGLNNTSDWKILINLSLLEPVTGH